MEEQQNYNSVMNMQIKPMVSQVNQLNDNMNKL